MGYNSTGLVEGLAHQTHLQHVNDDGKEATLVPPTQRDQLVLVNKQLGGSRNTLRMFAHAQGSDAQCKGYVLH